jgi:hypothetical protein
MQLNSGSMAVCSIGGGMTQEKIIEAIRSGTVSNRLSCEKAHEISATLGISLQEIGMLCNELKIKISSCQLGCF